MRTLSRVIFSACAIWAASSIPRERRNSRNISTMKFVISALFIFNFGCFSFCRSFTVLILKNLFFNLELLEMFLRQGFGAVQVPISRDISTSPVSTVEKSQSFDWKPVSQIFGAYIFIQIYHIEYVFFSLIIWYICVASFFLLTLSDSMFFAEGIPSCFFLPGCVDRWKWHDWFLCWILSQSSRTFHLPGSRVKTFSKTKEAFDHFF